MAVPQQGTITTAQHRAQTQGKIKQGEEQGTAHGQNYLTAGSTTKLGEISLCVYQHHINQ